VKHKQFPKAGTELAKNNLMQFELGLGSNREAKIETFTAEMPNHDTSGSSNYRMKYYAVSTAALPFASKEQCRLAIRVSFHCSYSASTLSAFRSDRIKITRQTKIMVVIRQLCDSSGILQIQTHCKFKSNFPGEFSNPVFLLRSQAAMLEFQREMIAIDGKSIVIYLHSVRDDPPERRMGHWVDSMKGHLGKQVRR
jgi:hypothetical protein